jgi:hypothetical protein
MSKFLVQDAASGLVVASSAVPGEGGGGGGSNATLTADTNIAAGTGVSINSSGNAAQTWGPAPQVPGTAVTFDGQGSNTIGTLILSPSQFVSFIAGVSAQAGSIDSNNVVSVGAVDTSGPSANAQLWNGNSGSVQAAVLSASKFVLAFSDPNTGNLNVVVGSIAANVITYGTPVEAVAASITLNPCCLNIFALDASHFALTYQNELVIGSVSGTTITLGSPGEITANVNGNPVALATMDATHILVAYQDGNDSNFLKLVVATVSGTDVSFGTPLTISVAQSSGNNAVMLLSPTQAAVTSYLIGGYEVYLVGISGTTLTLGHNASWDQSDGPFGVFAPMDATHFLIWSISNEEGVSSASVGTVTPSALTFEQLLLSPSDLYSFTGSSPHYLTVAGRSRPASRTAASFSAMQTLPSMEETTRNCPIHLSIRA